MIASCFVLSSEQSQLNCMSDYVIIFMDLPYSFLFNLSFFVKINGKQIIPTAESGITLSLYYLQKYYS